MTLFGAASVALMALAYALEKRHRVFVALFAIACTLSSAYGFLIGSIPFGSIEALWSLVALQRFHVATRVRPYGAVRAHPEGAHRSGLARSWGGSRGSETG